MRVFFKPQFVKDVRRLPLQVSSRVKEISLHIVPNLRSINDLKLRMEKLRGFDAYYRIRVGDYRIGLKVESNEVTFMRALHRKDIYRYFP
ncbi:MAG TPA: type II toxin-antitoxin system RelE/ParE family toxin [Candidatus Paceibacterota bacterium]